MTGALAETLQRFNPSGETVISPERDRQPEISPNPVIHLVNGAVHFRRLADENDGRPVTFDQMSDDQIRELTLDGKADMIYLIGWQPSVASARNAKKYGFEYVAATPDLDVEKDVSGSPFALGGYTPNRYIARDLEELGRGRDRLHKAGSRLIMDYTLHGSLDHPAFHEDPTMFILGSDEKNRNYPRHYFKRSSRGRDFYVAHAKEATGNPLPWEDTAAYNLANPKALRMMRDELLKIAPFIDGIRADMAHQGLLPVFSDSMGFMLSREEMNNLWKGGSDFWPDTIAYTKAFAERLGREFMVIGEAYEEGHKDQLWAAGMDALYEHSLLKNYELVINGHLPPRDLVNHLRHLSTAPDRRKHIVYTGNHDEPPPYSQFGRGLSLAVAAMTAMIPGAMYMVHDDQRKGRFEKTPIQVNRVSEDRRDPTVEGFYDRLLPLRHSPLVNTQNVEVNQAWNADSHEESRIITQRIEVSGFGGIMICSNIDRKPSNGWVYIPENTNVEVVDLVNDERIPDEVIDTPSNNGFFVGLPPGGVQLIGYRY